MCSSQATQGEYAPAQEVKPEKPKPSELDHKLRLLVEPVTQSPEADELYKSQLEEDSNGDIISVDDVPVSPVSLDNYYNTFFIFRDTKTRTLFSFTTKDKSDDTYLAEQAEQYQKLYVRSHLYC
jgi:hypothetical protein